MLHCAKAMRHRPTVSTIIALAMVTLTFGVARLGRGSRRPRRFGEPELRFGAAIAWRDSRR